MANKISQEEAISRIKDIHGDKYDCSKVVYVNVKTPITLVCPEHGEFRIIPDNIFRKGQGCGKCAGRGKSTDDFIKEARMKHGDRYDYSKSEYKGSHTPLIITCKEHGDFWMTPYNHIHLCCNCQKCSGCSVLTFEEFKKRAFKKYGDRFDYSNAAYTNRDAEISIKCNVCGTVFRQTPHNHLTCTQGGCPTCRYSYVAKSESIPFEEFVARSIEVHGNKYTYHKDSYFGIKNKTTITCPIHGDFEQQAMAHANGSGCNLCGNISISNTLTLNTDIFKQRAVAVHGDEYDYSKSIYIGNATPLTIICKKHGEFEMKPCDHWKGHGCPVCHSSSGERLIRAFLVNNNIEFVQEFLVKNVYSSSDKKWFRVDFFLPQHNIFIEFNGKQHYEPIDLWGGEKQFEIQKARDEAVRKYCIENGINLIEIPYTDISNIDAILTERIILNNN